MHPSKRPMHWTTRLMAVSAVAFLIGEGHAIANEVEGDTASERVREYFHIKGKFGTFVFLAFFGTFSAWFSAHIIKQSSGAPNI